MHLSQHHISFAFTTCFKGRSSDPKPFFATEMCLQRRLFKLVLNVVFTSKGFSLVVQAVGQLLVFMTLLLRMQTGRDLLGLLQLSSEVKLVCQPTQANHVF